MMDKTEMKREKPKMQFNVCATCGAKDGRAGNLFCIGDLPAECENCYGTRKNGFISINGNLRRTDEEIKKTFAILNTQTKDNG